MPVFYSKTAASFENRSLSLVPLNRHSHAVAFQDGGKFVLNFVYKTTKPFGGEVDC